jgi:cell division protein FtsI (penicillin-binding protein 3)
MLGRTDRRLRLLVLLIGFGLVAGMLVLRLAYWQVVRGAEMRESAMAQLERSVTQPSVRGDIFDRSGTVVLATTTYRDLLAAYPARIDPAERTRVASELTRLLELDVESSAKLTETLQRGGEYAVLFRALTRRQSDAVRAAMQDPDPSRRLDWLELEPQPVRAYPNEGGAPNTTLASRLLGFTNREGEGQYGIEQRFQDLLGGRPRVMTAQRDVSGRVIADTERLVDPGVPGSDIRLTIDAGLQLMLEKELYAAWVADRAKMASAVVMDPMTGEILAWASVPGYDANEYGRTADKDPSILLDPIVSEVYEPGSVMKMFVAAAAYDSGAIGPKTMIMDSSTLRFGTEKVTNSDHLGMGPITFEDGIAYSRNIVAARSARRLGKSVRAAAASLYGMWDRLGIGRKTGVETSGEVAGLVVDPATRQWAGIDLANRSFGQGVAVNQLQLAQAFAAMVNGGRFVRPRLVADLAGQPIEPVTAEQVLAADVSTELRELMKYVVTEVPWYRKGTLIPRYAVGGKTGTAQIWDSARGKWMNNVFNFSFVGFVGQTRDTPAAVIAVRIGQAEPHVAGQGLLQLKITSYELFRRIAVDVIETLGIPPQVVRSRDERGE